VDRPVNLRQLAPIPPVDTDGKQTAARSGLEQLALCPLQLEMGGETSASPPRDNF